MMHIPNPYTKKDISPLVFQLVNKTSTPKSARLFGYSEFGLTISPWYRKNRYGSDRGVDVFTQMGVNYLSSIADVAFNPKYVAEIVLKSNDAPLKVSMKLHRRYSNGRSSSVPITTKKFDHGFYDKMLVIDSSGAMNEWDRILDHHTWLQITLPPNADINIEIYGATIPKVFPLDLIPTAGEKKFGYIAADSAGNIQTIHTEQDNHGRSFDEPVVEKQEEKCPPSTVHPFTMEEAHLAFKDEGHGYTDQKYDLNWNKVVDEYLGYIQGIRVSHQYKLIRTGQNEIEIWSHKWHGPSIGLQATLADTWHAIGSTRGDHRSVDWFIYEILRRIDIVKTAKIDGLRPIMATGMGPLLSSITPPWKFGDTVSLSEDLKLKDMTLPAGTEITKIDEKIVEISNSVDHDGPLGVALVWKDSEGAGLSLVDDLISHVRKLNTCKSLEQ